MTRRGMRCRSGPLAPWRDELRATLALAWPLILANLTMALIQATDVVLMGRLGARPLAASALGLNLIFAFSLLGLGLVTASSPMMATALGRRSTQRARRPPHLPPVAVADRHRHAADLAGACGTPSRSSLALGQEPALARDAGHLPARLHVVDAAVPAVPGDAQFRLGARAAGLGAGDQPRRDRRSTRCSAGR